MEQDLLPTSHENLTSKGSQFSAAPMCHRHGSELLMPGPALGAFAVPGDYQVNGWLIIIPVLLCPGPLEDIISQGDYYIEKNIPLII